MSFKKRFRLWLIKHPGNTLIWLGMKSCRWKITGDEPYRALREAGRPVVLLIWHGKIFVVPFFFRKRGILALVSPSKDGEFVFRLMDGWGYKLIRGSGSPPMGTACRCFSPPKKSPGFPASRSKSPGTFRPAARRKSASGRNKSWSNSTPE